MDMRRLVGENVRQLRTKQGLTQEEFAEKSGFSQQYVSDLERGKRNPTVVTLFELGQALGVTPAALITPGESDVPRRRRGGGGGSASLAATGGE